MSDHPLRCSCGSTDFYVVSSGVSYRRGTIVESYHWPEEDEELAGDETLPPHGHDRGYIVQHEVLREPDLEAIDGPVKALCANCLADMTDVYLPFARPESLPV